MGCKILVALSLLVLLPLVQGASYTGDLMPVLTNTYDIGNQTLKYRNATFSGYVNSNINGSVFCLGNNCITSWAGLGNTSFNISYADTRYIQLGNISINTWPANYSTYSSYWYNQTTPAITYINWIVDTFNETWNNTYNDTYDSRTNSWLANYSAYFPFWTNHTLTIWNLWNTNPFNYINDTTWQYNQTTPAINYVNSQGFIKNETYYFSNPLGYRNDTNAINTSYEYWKNQTLTDRCVNDTYAKNATLSAYDTCLQSFTESDPFYNSNPLGYLNTSTGDNATFNQSLTDSLYYLLSNPFNFINDTSTLLDLATWNTNPFGYFNETTNITGITDSRYYLKLEIEGFSYINDTSALATYDYVDSLGNWSADKSSYATTDYADSLGNFSEWDKSTGISITESQISNLQSYLLVESDPKAYNGTLAYNDTLSAYDSIVSFPGFTNLLTDYSFTDNSVDWDTAYNWGDYRDNSTLYTRAVNTSYEYFLNSTLQQWLYNQTTQSLNTAVKLFINMTNTSWAISSSNTTIGANTIYRAGNTTNNATWNATGCYRIQSNTSSWTIC